MDTYYSIFPEERNSFSKEIEAMYFGNNFFERNLVALEPLINEDTAITSKNITSCCKSKMEMICHNPNTDSAELKKKFLEILVYICQIKTDIL